MREVLNELLKFEEENNLFELKIDGIYIWPIIRRRISDKILVHKNFLNEASHTSGSNLKEKATYVIKYLFYAFKNKFKHIPKVDEIIINHPRKIIIDGEYKDLYTCYIIEELKKNNKSYLVLDVPYNWHKHLIKKNNNIRNIENFSLVKKILLPKIKKAKYTNNKDLQILSNKLIQTFKTDGDLINVVNQEIQKFKADYHYFKKFLKKSKPKKLSVVISEVYPGIIQAAKDLNITTIEIQHGAITKEHMAYEFPNRKNVPYFPDQIRIFGMYWYDTVHMPISKKNVILTENRYLIEKSKEKKNRNSNQVLFVTQGWITSKMISYIEDFLELSDQYKVIIKLHPSEYEYWKKAYPKLVEIQKKYKVTIIDNFEKSLYDLMKESKYVVGVSSTCLYEAIAFDCEVHLVDLPSVEIMSDLVDKKIAKLAKSGKELLKNIKQVNKGKIDINYIYYRKED